MYNESVSNVYFFALMHIDKFFYDVIMRLMIVYRLMSKEELNLYLSGNIKHIGRCFLKGQLSNNHRYKKDEKYVHMFRRIKDIEFIKYDRDFEYLATFDIPIVTLMISHGKGLYKCFDYDCIPCKNVKEFAINVKRMKPEYFVAYESVDNFEFDDDKLLKLIAKSKETNTLEEKET